MVSKRLWAVLFGAITVQIIVVALLVFTQPVNAEDPQPPATFFAGSYAVIGQRATDQPPYAGTAVIETVDDEQLVLELTIDGVIVREQVSIADLEPMADATVLNLHDEAGMIVGSCLWTVDLDNYPRLTCLRKPVSFGEAPGHEAYFPQP